MGFNSYGNNYHREEGGCLNMGNVIDFRFPQSTIARVGLTLVKGARHFILSLPFEINGRGINSFPDEDNEGWFKCLVTLRAFDKLRIEYPIIEQAYEANQYYGIVDRLNARRR